MPTQCRPQIAGFIAALCVLIAGSAWSADDSKTALSACGSETPPFIFMKEGVGTGGFSVELLQRIATGLDRTVRILDLPWARCLRDVEAGRIDLAVDAFEDPARRTKFEYTKPYYTMTPQVFYVPGAGKGLPAATLEGLQKLKGCGIHEYTYEHYGLASGNMELGAKDNRQMLRMLIGGRCDFALEELEYITGNRKSMADWPDESSLRSYTPQWAKAPRLHFLIGKARPGARRLNAQIDAEIRALEKSGWLKQLRLNYFGSGQPSRHQ